jgi:hypothetical protein
MKFIKISRDLSKRLQRSLSHGYFKKISNSSNSSLTQSDYKSIIDKLDIANQEHAGSVDAIFSLLIKKNPDIENNAEFRNIRNGIAAEIFKMGGEYDKKLIQSVEKNALDIKREMFELVKKFYNSGYKIIAYDIMRQLSILSAWMDEAINEEDADKNKHKIKEIFSPDSDFHKSFLYLNKIKSLLQKPSLKDELAKFSTEIHRNENGKVVDIEKCLNKATNARSAADVGSAVGYFFGLLVDKGHNVSYVSNSDWGRDYDALQNIKPIDSISTIKDSFIKVDKECNIAREANGKVGIFDINNKNSTQTYVKDKQKRFNDFKTIVLNIFENKEKYDAEGYKLKNKPTDFFFDKEIPRKHEDAIDFVEKNGPENIVKLFKAVVTEGGMKNLDYRKCENIANKIGLNDLINNLIYNFNQFNPEYESAKIKSCLEIFITKFNDRINGNQNFFKTPGGKFFLKKHKGFNALSEGIRKITGGMSSGFDFITKSEGLVIQISDSFDKWHDMQKNDLADDKKALKNLITGIPNQIPVNVFDALSPYDIHRLKEKAIKNNANNILQGQIGNWRRVQRDNFDIEREDKLFKIRYKDSRYHPTREDMWGWGYGGNQYNPYQCNHQNIPRQPPTDEYIKKIVEAVRKGMRRR